VKPQNDEWLDKFFARQWWARQGLNL
jgi:hypothetical protein